jgi:CO/xanthine dehydrogenase FAD-binding subunit
MNWIAYEKPESLSEALTLLKKAEGKSRLIAGGTDLVLQMKRGVYHADLLVDITGIPGLKKIEEDEGWIRIGASVTHAEVEKHPLIRREAKALSEGCGRMGSPQIRNIGTLAGNIVSAQPAADGAIPLMALDAEIKVVSASSERWLPLEEAYQGIGRFLPDGKTKSPDPSHVEWSPGDPLRSFPEPNGESKDCDRTCGE